MQPLVRTAGIALLLAVAVLATPALAALEDVQRDCENQNHALTLDQQIAACSRLIEGEEEDAYNLAISLDYRGEAYFQQKKYQAAITDFTNSIRLNPNRAWTYFARGDAYSELGDLDRAIADYSTSIRLDPKQTWPWNNRGWAYYKKGDLDHAISDYDQAVRIDPRNQLAYINLGDAYGDKGQFDKAVTAYSKVIQLNSSNAGGWNGRGWAYYKKGDYERAIADLQQASRLEPNNPLPLGNLGDVYADKKQYDLAIQYYTAALRNDPQNAYGYNARGWVHAQKGELDLAIADYEQALRLKPDFKDAIENRARAYESKGVKPPSLGAPVPRVDLSRSIQSELQRLGCEPGMPDGIWGPASQRALAAYNRASGTNYGSPVPELLDELRGRSAPVCGAAASSAPSSVPAPVPPPQSSPELSLAGSWSGSSDCPLDTGFTLTLAPIGREQYRISGSTGISGWVSGTIVHFEAQILINHVVWDGSVDSPNTMSGTVAPSLMLGAKCNWQAHRN